MKRFIVLGLERLDGLLDRFPFYDHEYGWQRRHGLSALALKLDERWDTGVWTLRTGRSGDRD